MSDSTLLDSHEKPKHAGDVLVTSGGSPLSKVIRGVTCSPWSHVAITAYVTRENVEKYWPAEDWSDWENQTLVFESTSQSDLPCHILGKNVSGLQAHRVLPWIANYGGRIYRMRFLGDLTEEESKRLTEYLLSQLKKEIPYDWGGAILAGTRVLKWFPCLAKWVDDRHSRFCVETVETVIPSYIYERELPVFDPGRDRPRDLVRKLSKSKLWSRPNQLN